MSRVNLDALIPREDFEITRNREDAPIKPNVQLRDLEPREFFFSALRKPDFQRETDDWDPQRVADLIETFLNGDLIPAIVLWRNRDLYFVIDGAHRLSALIAWVHDDYGDGDVSHKFFNRNIPAEQSKIAKRTRELVEKAFGSYQDHKKAVEQPERFSKEIQTRARQLGASLSLELQWVRGESSAKADQSFKRINQRSAIISPQEFHLLETRRQPITVASRAILRRGAGHKYWEDRRQEIETLSGEIHDMLYLPALQSPIKTPDLPVGGSPYAANALVTVHDLVSLCVPKEAKERMAVDDTDGATTVECLKFTRRAMQLLCSNHPSSMGLHPAIYFYSWTGKHQPILLLTLMSLILEYDKQKKLDDFVEVRSQFEEFLTGNRALVNQVIRKFGSKDPKDGKLRGFYQGALSALEQKTPLERLIPKLRENPIYSFLQPDEAPYPTAAGKGYSSRARTGILISEFLAKGPRCQECNSSLPVQALSVDHNDRREDGGSNSTENAGVTHPYCNTGHKERRVSQSRR